jgi:purine-binding chemotaxis protein CheW
MGTIPDTAAEQTQYLTFYIASEEYAVALLRVREIIEYDTVTRVPQTPTWIRGVINVRGSVVPVIDLAVKFGLPESPVTRRTCVVIVEVDIEGQQTAMGVIADVVSQVVDLAHHDIEPTPPFGTRVKVDFLLGMAKLGKRFALVLDIDRVLSTGELIAAAATAEPEGEDAETGSEAESKDDTPAASDAASV